MSVSIQVTFRSKNESIFYSHMNSKLIRNEDENMPAFGMRKIVNVSELVRLGIEEIKIELI